jgi:hypothetical protein
MGMAKLIYLDSLDFSDLSATAPSIQNAAALETLALSKKTGTAKFLLSSIHLSEATHSSEKYKDAATRRATLMTTLCESQTLRFPNEIFSTELAQALETDDGRLETSKILSSPSEWFGIELKPDMDAWRKSATSALNEKLAHLPRRERRKFSSELNLRSRRGREHWRALIRQSPPSVIDEFPFNLIERDFVFAWLLGDRSDPEFLRRLLPHLSNPTVMIGQILDATEQRQKIYDALRTQGNDMAESLKKHLSKLFDALSLVGDEQAETIAKNFKARLPKHELFRALLESYCVGTIPNIDDDQLLRIVSACPALSAFSNAFLNYAVDLFHANFQKLKMPNRSVSHGKASDFGDLLQASYAPYVDIFRCDGPFGAVLKKDENIRRKIVEKRARLISLLREDLEL